VTDEEIATPQRGAGGEKMRRSEEVMDFIRDGEMVDK
jgi:hypothetical protein